jgi:hypothetical protein
MLSMLESAIQKLLVVTIIGGKKFWEGIDLLGESVYKTLHISSAHGISYWIIITYILIFLVWAVFLTVWNMKLPIAIAKRANWYLHLSDENLSATQVHKKKRQKWFYFILLALGLGSYFLSVETPLMSIFIFVLRTFCIYAIWQLIITPLFHRQMKKIHTQNILAKDVQKVMATLPPKALYQEVSKKYSGLRRYKEFVLGLLSLAHE